MYSTNNMAAFSNQLRRLKGLASGHLLTSHTGSTILRGHKKSYFAGASTLPSQIRNVLSQIIEHIVVDKTAGIWDTVVWVISQDLLLLKVNTVILVYKECRSHEAVARKIGKHAPSMCSWGVEFNV
ncbi:hypothetical protein L210DRAFT_3504525 [Boletus edulis BED1]|uniref:Uncharacterized protein n=1 Tax=Boletus edulis BED1 TaxID=1328754 RepID=A0AAD4BTV2_BOLED|nr:hypothetical protein L210DRAFT_3504525 [Boletus edulis BED1]